MYKYFKFEEFVRSDVANIHGIQNVPGYAETENIKRLCGLLDRVRERWGAPIRINSGYRCETLNRKVGGAARSAHLSGEAADITSGMRNSNKVLFDLIRTMQADGEIEFDQLIDEKDFTWIHIAIKANGNRNQILSLK